MHPQPYSSNRLHLTAWCLLPLLAVAGRQASAAIPAPREILRHAIVVTVNGKQIFKEDLQEMAAFLFRQRYGDKIPRFTSAEYERINELYRQMAVRELIKMELIRDEARDLQIKVEVNEVDQQLDRLRMRKDKAGVTRKMAECELLFDRIMARQGIPSYRPSPSEIRAFYANSRDAFKQNRLVVVRSIFLALDDETAAPVLQRKLEAIRRDIAGRPRSQRSKIFAACAREFSEDAFKDQGGLIRISPDPDGWFPQDLPRTGKDGRSIFPDAMRRGIKGLARKGDISPVLRSERGFHLLYLEAAKGGKVLPFQNAVPVVTRYLEQRERTRRMARWIKDKWRRSDVKWHDGNPYPLDDILASMQAGRKKTRPR